MTSAFFQLRVPSASAFWFAAYVLWLTAFPMSGVLLAPGERMMWFTLPHALTLMVLGHRLLLSQLYQWLPWAVAGAAFLTVVYGFVAGQLSGLGSGLLLLLGVVTAPLSIGVGVGLAAAPRPVVAAALGLCLGNLSSFLLALAPGSATFKLALLACLLPGMLVLRAGFLSVEDAGSALAKVTGMPNLWRLLPFIAIFQIVSGLMYGYLWQAGEAAGSWAGIELLAYVLGVLLVARYLGSPTLLGALAAVVLAIGAFAVHHAVPSLWGQFLALCLMLLAAGIVDLLLLVVVLAQENRIRAYGYAVGVMVLGIVLGDGLVSSLSGSQLSVALLALVLLNLATVALFLPRQSEVVRSGESAPVSAPMAVVPAEAMPIAVAQPVLAPAQALSGHPLFSQLSEQELRVLQALRGNCTYKEIAQNLGISESSVKTYVQRIYRKLGVYRRSQLAALVEQVPPVPPAGDVGPP